MGQKMRSDSKQYRIKEWKIINYYSIPSPIHLNFVLSVFKHVSVLRDRPGRSLQRFGAFKRKERCLQRRLEKTQLINKILHLIVMATFRS